MRARGVLLADSGTGMKSLEGCILARNPYNEILAAFLADFL
jgi:hypothetical protein